jgi:hypothetical protein
MRRIDNYKELNNIFSIYQLKGGEETRPSTVLKPLDRLEMAGLSVNKGQTTISLYAPLSDIDTLEDIYRRLTTIIRRILRDIAFRFRRCDTPSRRQADRPLLRQLRFPRGAAVFKGTAAAAGKSFEKPPSFQPSRTRT